MTAVVPSKLKLLPAYGIGEAASILGLSPSTLRSWTIGRSFPTKEGNRESKPLLTVHDDRYSALSFIDMAEAWVIATVVRGFGIPIRKVRRAVQYLHQCGNSDLGGFLAHESFYCDRKDLFLIMEQARLVSLTERGQIVGRELVEDGLSQLKFRDPDGFASRLLLRTAPDRPPTVMVDPRINFGQPTLAEYGIITRVLVDRVKAGEDEKVVAADFGVPPSAITEARLWHGRLAA